MRCAGGEGGAMHRFCLLAVATPSRTLLFEVPSLAAAHACDTCLQLVAAIVVPQESAQRRVAVCDVAWVGEVVTGTPSAATDQQHEGLAGELDQGLVLAVCCYWCYFSGCLLI